MSLSAGKVDCGTVSSAADGEPRESDARGLGLSGGN